MSQGRDSSGQDSAGQNADRGYRVLIVDDNLPSAEMLSEILALEGHTVQMAHTGADALRIAPGFAPDVAVLDIGLPDQDGFEPFVSASSGGDAPDGCSGPARGCAFLYTSSSWAALTCVYRCVVESCTCPSSSWIARRSAPRCSRCVANEWRSACGLMPNRVLHAATYRATRR